MTKTLTAIPATIIAALTFAGVAHANPSTASATCRGGIVYEGHSYPSAGNTVTVKVDGQVVAGYPKTFGDHISGNVQFADKTVGHTWSVIWDRFSGTDGDREQHDLVTACEQAATTTAASTTTTLAAATSSVLVAYDDELTPVIVPVYTTPTLPPPAVVAVDAPPVPQGVSAAGQTLPQTGGTTGGLIRAAVLVAGGFLVLFVARRRAT